MKFINSLLAFVLIVSISNTEALNNQLEEYWDREKAFLKCEFWIRVRFDLWVLVMASILIRNFQSFLTLNIRFHQVIN
ncbi:MAG: hypothetical protein U5K54_15295 [Cytophagales bacterium]|nr:hypothetical protein [Cytophagales bacterium]